jgi:hypothetical protein
MLTWWNTTIKIVNCDNRSRTRPDQLFAVPVSYFHRYDKKDTRFKYYKLVYILAFSFPRYLELIQFADFQCVFTRPIVETPWMLWNTHSRNTSIESECSYDKCFARNKEYILKYHLRSMYVLCMCLHQKLLRIFIHTCTFILKLDIHKLWGM